jgi:hypothetical protein
MVAPTCLGITLPSSESVPSAFWEMLNWGAVDRILWMGVLCLVTWCVVIWDLCFSFVLFFVLFLLLYIAVCLSANFLQLYRPLQLGENSISVNKYDIYITPYALRCQSECPRIYPRCCNLIFFPRHPTIHVPRVDSASKNEYHDTPGGKYGRCVWLTTYHLQVPMSRNLEA